MDNIKRFEKAIDKLEDIAIEIAGDARKEIDQVKSQKFKSLEEFETAYVRYALEDIEQAYESMRSIQEYLGGEIESLSEFLHSKEMHPDYEYGMTHGPRKLFDEYKPEGERWERNESKGRKGWERFDYHEEAYWMREKEIKGIR